MLLSVVQLNIFCTCLSFNEHSLRSVHLNERCTRTCLRETSPYPPPPPLITAQREQLFASTLNHISLVSSFRRRFCDLSPTSRSFGNICAGSTKDFALLYSGSAWFGPRPRQRLFWQVLLHFPQVSPDKFQGSIWNDAAVSSLKIFTNSLLFTYHYNCAQCELVTVVLNNRTLGMPW